MCVCVELKVTDEERGSRERGKQRIKKYWERGKEEGSEEGKEGRYLPPSERYTTGWEGLTMANFH